MHTKPWKEVRDETITGREFWSIFGVGSPIVQKCLSIETEPKNPQVHHGWFRRRGWFSPKTRRGGKWTSERTNLLDRDDEEARPPRTHKDSSWNSLGRSTWSWAFDGFVGNGRNLSDMIIVKSQDCQLWWQNTHPPTHLLNGNGNCSWRKSLRVGIPWNWWDGSDVGE